MSIDIRLAEDGSLDLSNNTMTLTSTNNEIIRQRILIKLRTYKGEWAFNTNFGIPYLKNDTNPVQLLTKTGSGGKNALDLEIKKAVLEIEGVLSFKYYESSLGKRDRKLTVSFIILTEAGEIDFSNVSVV